MWTLYKFISKYSISVCELFVSYDWCLQTTKAGVLGNQAPNYTVPDCRSLVKTLVSGVKTITWGTASCKAPAMGQSFVIAGYLCRSARVSVVKEGNLKVQIWLRDSKATTCYM